MTIFRVLLSVLPHWYFLEVPGRIFARYRAWAGVVSSAFPFLFLLTALVSPWKSIRGSYPNAFIPGQIFQAWTLNLVSRGVGFVVRVVTLGLGVTLSLLTAAAFFCVFLLWVSYPFLVSLVLLLRSL